VTEVVKPASVSIRAMLESDADAVHRLALQLGYPTQPAATLARVRAVLASNIADAFVAEDADGRVLGWAHVFAAPFLESGPNAELGGLVVEEAARGRGIGAALVARAESWARERGIRKLCLRSNVVRTEAHAFYQKIGFTIQKSQFKFQKEIS
jgi:GNAT superfamily N-acetyltransferase